MPAAAPEVTETISYRVTTFKLGTRNLVHYAGFTDHSSFFPGSAATTDSFKDELGRIGPGEGLSSSRSRRRSRRTQ